MGLFLCAKLCCRISDFFAGVWGILIVKILLSGADSISNEPEMSSVIFGQSLSLNLGHLVPHCRQCYDCCLVYISQFEGH